MQIKEENTFIKIKADFHLHGLYSGAVSKSMLPRVIGKEAPFKGINIVGTGDILNEKWVKLIREQLKKGEDEAILEHSNQTKFILQCEIEDKDRVHHLILFPSFSKVEEVKERFRKHSPNLHSDGRPRIQLKGEEIAEICLEAECLLGPAHAFTPYFGLYSKFNSYKESYGDYWRKIYFLELGLSADTYLADQISELHNLTFLSNSDAHSPWPNKIGREFNTLLIKEITFKEIKKALKREGHRKCVLNVGFNPLEGKYHRTRCSRCLYFFKPKDALNFNWKCPNCGGPIKKGVDYRIQELANLGPRIHPDHRPEYKHLIPLSEIIALAWGLKNSWSTRVQQEWKKFIKKFGPEINILLKVNYDKIKKINNRVAEFIQYFREGKIKYIPGGGGVYGKLLPPGKHIEIKEFKEKQKKLDDF